MPRFPDNELKPNGMSNNATENSILVSIVAAFSNQTGEIIKHQIIVTTNSNEDRDVPVTDYYRRGTKTAFVAIECSHFFSNECPLVSQHSHRRRRSPDNSDSYTVEIGADNTCSDNSLTWCNGNLEPSTVYYVMYRACNTKNQCSSTPFSGPMKTRGRSF